MDLSKNLIYFSLKQKILIIIVILVVGYLFLNNKNEHLQDQNVINLNKINEYKQNINYQSQSNKMTFACNMLAKYVNVTDETKKYGGSNLICLTDPSSSRILLVKDNKYVFTFIVTLDNSYNFVISSPKYATMNNGYSLILSSRGNKNEIVIVDNNNNITSWLEFNSTYNIMSFDITSSDININTKKGKSTNPIDKLTHSNYGYSSNYDVNDLYINMAINNYKYAPTLTFT